MQVYEMKMILQRSNPSLIRQFTVPANYTLNDLNQIVHIFMGWEQMHGFVVWQEDKELAAKTKLNELKKQSFYFNCAHSDVWHFRIEFLGETEQEKNPIPQLVRFCGNLMPYDCNCIEMCNRLQFDWTEKLLFAYDGYLRKHPVENYILSAARINRNLKMCFGSEQDKFKAERLNELCYSKCQSNIDLLKSKTVSELKDVAKHLHILLPSNVRKDQIIILLNQEMAAKESMDALLSNFTQKEYEIFRDVCCGKITDISDITQWELLKKLEEAGYAKVERFYGQTSVKYYRELLYAYEGWIVDEDEAQYLKESALRSVLMCGINLYGIISKERFKSMTNKYIPDALIDDIERAWQWAKDWALTGNVLSLHKAGFLYDARVMNDKDAAAVFRIHKQSRIRPYVPPADRIYDYAAGGLFFTEDEIDSFTLKASQYRYISDRELREGLMDIYKHFRCGASVDDVKKCSLVRLFMHNRKSAVMIDEELKKLQIHVRQILLIGHTAKEVSHV